MNKDVFAIGVMSGTSLDGVDMAYVKFSKGTAFEIICAETVAYSQEWFNVLKNISTYPKGAPQLNKLDKDLGLYYAELLTSFIEKNKIRQIDFISSHGHTVHHQPKINYTLQMGCGEIISDLIGCKVVYDFRTADVLSGGQGAPLVPVADRDLFKDYDYCLNLGGFANVSFQQNNERWAYDICPVNTVLNLYAAELGFSYDDKGQLAEQGNVHKDLLKELNQLSFYDKIYPKSLGIEFVHEKILPVIKSYPLEVKDVLATYTFHVAHQLGRNLKSGKILITGGGVYNDYLIKLLNKESPLLEVCVPDDLLIEFKEALAFAYLGFLRINGKNNCLSTVTGVRYSHSSGRIVEN